MSSDSNSSRIRRLLKRPLLFGSTVLTTVTTLWGLVSIFKDAREFFGESTAGYIFVLLIVLCLLPAVMLFFVSVWRWWFFIPVSLRTRFLQVEVVRNWEINDLGGAVVTQEKSLLFFRPPTKEDLADLIFSSESLQLHELNQRSEDCEYIDHYEISKGVHKVYWKPKKGEIVVGKPYKHKTVTHFPFHQVPTFKCMTIPFAAATLKFKLQGSSKLRISHVVAYRGSRYFRLSHSAERIARRGQKVKWTRAPLPVLHDPNSFTWEIKDISPGESYFVVLYF